MKEANRSPSDVAHSLGMPAKKIRAWHSDVARYMGEMPSEEDLLLMKSKNNE